MLYKWWEHTTACINKYTAITYLSMEVSGSTPAKQLSNHKCRGREFQRSCLWKRSNSFLSPSSDFKHWDVFWTLWRRFVYWLTFFQKVFNQCWEAPLSKKGFNFRSLSNAEILHCTIMYLQSQWSALKCINCFIQISHENSIKNFISNVFFKLCGKSWYTCTGKCYLIGE